MRVPGLFRLGGTGDRLVTLLPRVSSGKRSYTIAIETLKEHVRSTNFVSKTDGHGVCIRVVLECGGAETALPAGFVGYPPVGMNAAPERGGVGDGRIIPVGKGRGSQAQVVGRAILALARHRQESREIS